MQKLLMPAAEVLAMDATDSSTGDRLLKRMGKDVSEGHDVHQLLLPWRSVCTSHVL